MRALCSALGEGKAAISHVTSLAQPVQQDFQMVFTSQVITTS